MPYNSFTIANYFIKKYSNQGNITPLKLLKLVYISYGWYLAYKDNKEPLISESPQAWKNGPVFPNLYHEIKKHGMSPIKDPIEYVTNDAPISDEVSAFLDRIWEIYGDKDGVYLSAITHMPDTPWSDVYPKGYNLVIPDDLILDHYKSKIKPQS